MENILQQTRMIVGGSVVILGAILALSGFRLRRSHRFETVIAPIVLSKDRVQQYEFDPDFTGPYIIQVVLDPKDVRREECLLGNRGFFSACDHQAADLDLEWSVMDQAGSQIGSGLYVPLIFGGSNGVQAEIGRFSATNGVHYRLRITPRQTASEIQLFNPRVLVEPHWKLWEGISMRVRQLFIAALAFLSLGFVILARPFRLN